MKKFLALLLCISMLLGIGVTAQAESTFDKHIKITIGHWDVETFFAGDAMLDYIEKKFNVTFEPINVTWSDYGQKYQLWASTDSLPDIFSPDARNGKLFREWAEAGVIAALPEDLSAWPNLQAYMETNNHQEGTVDGVYYALCRNTFNAANERIRDRMLYYRWDLAQAAGITEEPTNYDEFRAMILAIIKADPEKKGVQGLIAGSYTDLRARFQPYSIPHAVHSDWVQEGDRYVPAYLAGDELGQDAIPYFQLMRDMYQEGTIDHDIVMSNTDMATNKFVNGQSAALMVSGSTNWLAAYEAVNGPWEDSIRMMSIMPGVDGNAYYGPTEMSWSDLMFGSACTGEKMERVLSILDWLYTDEGKRFVCLGFEGVDYTVDEETKTLSYVEEGAGINDVIAKYPSMNVFCNWLYWCNSASFGEYTADLGLYNELDSYALNILYAQAAATPLPEFEPLGRVVARDYNGDFGGLATSANLLTIMTGSEPVEDMWASILADYKADSLEEYIQFVNDGIAAQKK